MVHLVVVITMTTTTKKQLCDTTFLLQVTKYNSFKDSKQRNVVNILASHEMSFFKIRKVEQFEASSSTDGTADVYHMVHWRKYSK